MSKEVKVDINFAAGTRVMFQEDDCKWIKGRVLRALYEEDDMPLKMLADEAVWSFSEKELKFFFGSESDQGNRLVFFNRLNGKNLCLEK
ncbi:MAG: hypothetical protein PHQ59_00135 [Candidatus Daviesbacteria bacterium]|nr:hypothetical protein [Candidatus Daviesbacteria bacterium]